MSDERTPASERGAVSIRVGREGWRFHAPTYVLMALVAAINGGSCSKQDDIADRVTKLEIAFARFEGALGPRLTSGAEGAGGTSAVAAK